MPIHPTCHPKRPQGLFLVVAIVTLLHLSSGACMNYFYGTTKDGHLYDLGYDWKMPFSINFNQPLNVRKLKQAEKILLKEHTYMALSDYALCLLKLGKTNEALTIFKALYNHYPNDFKLASNLGSAYELSGQNDSALKYINRNLTLNKHDHAGSEWIHVKILETKLQLQKDPNYLKSHTVLQLSDVQKKDTAILKQLSIQLQERFPFTPNNNQPNEIMASLLCDLGDLCFNIGSIEYASAYYQIAKNYYHSQRDDIDSKLSQLKGLQKKYIGLKAPQHERIEGMANRISFFKYTNLLSDNDDTTYNIKWENINTNVSELLAAVNLKLNVEEVKKQDGQVRDSIHLLEEEGAELKMPANTASAPTSTKAEKWSSGTIVLITLIFLIPLILLIIRFFRK